VWHVRSGAGGQSIPRRQRLLGALRIPVDFRGELQGHPDGLNMERMGAGRAAYLSRLSPQPTSTGNLFAPSLAAQWPQSEATTTSISCSIEQAVRPKCHSGLPAGRCPGVRHGNGHPSYPASALSREPDPTTTMSNLVVLDLSTLDFIDNQHYTLLTD
jgi:hypothetical protein